VRGFVIRNRKNITTWFASEGEFVTSMYSIITGRPSFESIEVLEDSELDYILKEDLENLYDKFPVMNKLGRIILEKYYIDLEEIVISMQFRSAKEKYNYFINKYPNLFSRVKLGHIASFLGISNETLSRIRS
jgi:hypothetical protein